MGKKIPKSFILEKYSEGPNNWQSSEVSMYAFGRHNGAGWLWELFSSAKVFCGLLTNKAISEIRIMSFIFITERLYQEYGLFYY